MTERETGVKQRGEADPLRIVCTDRGQHGTALLGLYWHMVDGSHRLTSPLGSASAWGPTDHEPVGPCSTISTNSIELYCARCGRNPRRSDFSNVFLAPVYDDSRLAELDISLLDF